MNIEEIVKREKKSAEEFLNNIVKPVYLETIERAIRSGGVNMDLLKNNYFLAQIVFNLIGERETLQTLDAKELKMNLEYLIPQFI